jgi:hypothetical protein
MVFDAFSGTGGARGARYGAKGRKREGEGFQRVDEAVDPYRRFRLVCSTSEHVHWILNV